MNQDSSATSRKNSKNRQEGRGGRHSYERVAIGKSIQTILLVAALSATVFTMWTPANLFSNQLMDRMILAVQSGGSAEATPLSPTTPTAAALPLVGLVAGHWQFDSGAVCSKEFANGLTEVTVNLRIATLVRQNLIEEGYSVDLLSEFDTRLTQYQALALISIHNDSCSYINDEATGFKVAAAMSNNHPEKANRLAACLINRYQDATNLQFHHNTITKDMASYHAFEEVDPNTPAVIIETGFLNLDLELLTQEPDRVAQGISDGILCYLRNEPMPIREATPQP
jgi:N-acetylmuramoyl-L-alanine amidase